MKQFDQVLLGFIIVGLFILSDKARAEEPAAELIFNESDAEIVIAQHDSLPHMIPLGFQGFAFDSRD